MRILVVTHYFPAHGGGIELTAYHLARQLAEKGHEIVWLSSDVDAAPGPVAGIECRPLRAWNFIEATLQVPYPIWSPLGFGRLWQAVGDSDVVHVHEYVYPCSLAAVAIAKLRRKPVVLTQHTGAVVFPSRWLTSLYSIANRVMGRWLLGLASQVVFISDNVCRYFSGFCRFATPPRLIFNGLDAHWCPADTDEERRRLRKELGLEDTRDTLLFAGRFVVKKGLDVIRTLVPLFNDVEWLMAGAGPVRPELWGYRNLRILGPLEPGQLARVYRASDLLILPSHTEGFPLVVQEALASGLAVLSTHEVATACPEAADMIRSAPVPSDPGHVQSWARALSSVLGDREFIEDRKARSRRARSLWSWSACADAYVQAYISAAAGASAARGRS